MFGMHSQLQEALANHLRSRIDHPPMVFTEIALEKDIGGRLDVLSLSSYGRYTNAYAVGYEVKVTKADLLHDASTRKYEKYFSPLDQLWFCFPVGIATEDDVPEECGVLVYYPTTKHFRTARRAKSLKKYGDGITESMLLKILWRANDMLKIEQTKEDRFSRLQRMRKVKLENGYSLSLSESVRKMISNAQQGQAQYAIQMEKLEIERQQLQGADGLLSDLSLILSKASEAVTPQYLWGDLEEKKLAISEKRGKIREMADSLRSEIQREHRANMK